MYSGWLWVGRPYSWVKFSSCREGSGFGLLLCFFVFDLFGFYFCKVLWDVERGRAEWSVFVSSFALGTRWHGVMQSWEETCHCPHRASRISILETGRGFLFISLFRGLGGHIHQQENFVYPFICEWTLFGGQFWIMLLWPLVYKCLSESLLSIPLCLRLGVELLDHVVLLCLAFWGATKMFYSNKRGKTCGRYR